MTAPFALLISLCGLTQREAAQLCGVREDTARAWVSGRRTAPAGVIEQLRVLWGDIEATAEHVISARHEPAVIEAMADIDDVQAQAQGLPLAAAWRQALALAIARQGALSGPTLGQE